MNKHRLSRLTDTVLTGVLVLLAARLNPPFYPQVQGFLFMWREYLACVAAMVWLVGLLGGMIRSWRRVEEVGAPAGVMTLVMLLLCLALPFAASLVAAWPNRRLMQGMYGGLMLLITLLNILILRLLGAENSRDSAIVRGRRAAWGGALLLIASLAVCAFVWPKAPMFGALAAGLWQLGTCLVPEKHKTHDGEEEE